MVVMPKGFRVSEGLSGVFRVCEDVGKVNFAVVTEVLDPSIGVVEVNFVVLIVSAGKCVPPLEVTVGVVVFSVGVRISETLGVSVLEVRGNNTLTVGEVASVELMLDETGSTGRVLTLVGSLLEVGDRAGLEVGGKGIVVVRVSSVEDSVGLLVVEVPERNAEIYTGLVCNVEGEV